MDIRSSVPTPATSLTSGMTLPVQTPSTGPAPAASAVMPSVAVPPVSEADVRQATDTINRFMASASRSLAFSVDDDSGKIVVKVIDPSTKEVIRQFPSEEAIAISKSLDKLQGMLVDDKA
jgi:flagellar protein FlaG